MENSNKLKAAVLYRGFYDRKKHRRRYGIMHYIFCKEVLENNVRNLLKFYDCDIYFHTYTVNDESNNNMINIFSKMGYKPKKYIFETFYEENHSVGHSMVESLKLIEGNYDIVISIRFDLIIYRPIVARNIKGIGHLDHNKFNILFKDKKDAWEGKDKKVSDLLYVFPQTFAEHLKNALIENMNYKDSAGHFIYNPLSKCIGSEKINFMMDGYHVSNTDMKRNSLVRIKRF